MPRSPHLEVLFLGKSELDADGILGAGVGHRQALVIRHILPGACQEHAGQTSKLSQRWFSTILTQKTSHFFRPFIFKLPSASHQLLAYTAKARFLLSLQKIKTNNNYNCKKQVKKRLFSTTKTTQLKVTRARVLLPCRESWGRIFQFDARQRQCKPDTDKFFKKLCYAQYYTDKKENKFFPIYKEIQSGAVSKSYMRKGFPIYEEMGKYFPIYKEAVSYVWLCNCSILNFLIYGEILIFFFITVIVSLFVLCRYGQFFHKLLKFGGCKDESKYSSNSL